MSVLGPVSTGVAGERKKKKKNQWPTDILCQGLAHSGQRGHIQPRAPLTSSDECESMRPSNSHACSSHGS